MCHECAVPVASVLHPHTRRKTERTIQRSMAAHQVLFCPFCRESFEDLTRCPDHDLVLIGFDRLGPDPLDAAHDPDVIDNAPLDALDLRFGRGWVAAAAVLNALALGCEFVRGVGPSAGLSVRELAVTAPSLWTLPIVSFVLLYALRRRNTPRALRGLRVLVPMLAFVTPLTFGWVMWRLHQGVAVWATGKRTIGLDPGSAWYVVAVASLMMLIGGLRLGVHRKGPRQPDKTLNPRA